jgi:hypothetical protein
LSVEVVADEKISGSLDLDFISLGGMSNLMTIAAFENAGNQLAMYDRSAGFFVSKKDGRWLCEVREGYDCGLILKMAPSQFPQRTWIVCDGIGEWGTPLLDTVRVLQFALLLQLPLLSVQVATTWPEDGMLKGPMRRITSPITCLIRM